MQINITVRPAVPEDIDRIKEIADANKNFIGFVRRPALVEAQQRGWLYVAIGNKSDKILGFANIWKRRDGWATIMEICVDQSYRGYGVGAQLLHALPRPLKLKCTVENPANKFYARVGCKTDGVETGKKRALQKWILI